MFARRLPERRPFVNRLSVSRPCLIGFGVLLAACAPAEPDNRPPAVSAGDDRSVQNAVVSLDGAAGDPDGDVLKAEWSQTAGPAGVGFADETAPQTTATLPEAGSYTLQLSATDGAATVADEITLSFEPSAEPPVPPITPPTGTWEELPPSSQARQEVSFVQVDGLFYLAGGSTLHEVYDPVAQTWTTLTPLPEFFDHVQAVTVDGLIYYLGGLAAWPGPHLSTVYIYDPATDSFSGGAPLPRGRGAGGVAVYGGKVYYAGGLHTDDLEDVSSTEAVAWFDVYDPVTDAWASLPEMSRVRDHFHAAVLDGVFYAVGGRDTTINATNPSADAFDLETQTWTTLDTEFPTERGGYASAVLGDEILIFGGEGGGTHDEVEAYNPVTDAWRTLSPMPTARHGIQAAVCGNGVYIAAGGVKQGLGPSTVYEAMFFGEPADCAAQ